MTRLRTILIPCVFALSTTAGAQDVLWTTPFPAFRLADNLYYVGTKGLASYLVTSPRGHILINSDLESNVPQIKASVEQLGFKFADIRILLISHAHWDHDAGSALVKRMTGAAYMVMEGDVSVVESGGKTDFHYGTDWQANKETMPLLTEEEQGLKSTWRNRAITRILLTHRSPTLNGRFEYIISKE